MSSYKGYVPWKTNLSSYLTSKTSPAGSRYSSRDEVMGTSTDLKQMPRFGSIASPSTYRPSYSGGTYRSSGIKRETPIPSSYTGRWSTSNKDAVTKETSTTRKSSKSSSTSDSISDNKSISNGHISTAIKPKLKEQASNSVRPTITVAKARIRDQNSSTSSYSSSKSRDPSPSEPIKDRYTSSSGYVSSSYSKLYPKSSNKLQINSFRTIGTSNPAISYLNGSEMSVRVRKSTEKQQKDKQKEKSPKSSSESSPSKEMSNVVSTTPNADDSTPSSESKSTEEMVEVTVVTRGTSPNLCSTTNYSRCRRADVAKTIEKVVLRPKRKTAGEDKEVQSDRMDDTSKYCRFNATRSSTPWPSYLESKYNPVSYTRYNNGATPTKYSPLAKSDKSSNESSPEKVPEKSLSKSRESSVQKSPSSSRSGSFRSSSKSEKSKSKSPPVSSQKSTSLSAAKTRSLSNKSLPPPAPKTETSPSKVILEPKPSDELKTDRNGKWANKDFRKSALNVGPSDRPRKSRNASVDSDQHSKSDDQQHNESPLNRTERSPSTSSEASHSSSNPDELTKNLLKLKISSNLQKPNETMHLNTNDSMAHETKMVKTTTTSPASIVSQNEKLQQQSQQQPSHIPKIDNAKSPSVVARSLDAVVKIFKSSKSDRLIETQNVSDNDSAFSINESTEQDTLIEPVLNRTTTITNLSKTVNSNSYLADESSWINSTVNEKTTTDTPLRQLNYPNKTNMKIQLRHIDSADQLSWWITDTENDDTVADDITLNQSDNEITFNNNNNNHNDTNSSKNHYQTDEIDTSQTEQSIPWWKSGENNSRSEERKYRITHIKSGERAWWLDDDTEESVNDILEAAETNNNNSNDAGSRYTFKIKKIESGERAWWLCEDNDSTNIDINNENDGADIDFWASINESLEPDKNDKTRRTNDHLHSANRHYDMNANYIPLGDRASPEGLEDMNNGKENRLSPYDNVGASKLEQNFSKLFISRHENIDDVLGGPVHALSPIFFDNKSDSFVEIQPSQVRIHDGTAQTSHIQYMDGDRDNRDYTNLQSGHLLDDATIQVYKDGDYGAYLDLESSLAEQSEEIEGLHSNQKNSLVVRTQLSVRVHAIIEKLLTSEGRELRRALFSLKQIFQDDKDLVHGFVALGGLNSLVRVGNNADQNYQNYILRALGQVMLYVDGMNGVMRHSPTIQWLYSLISSKFRLVVKTALKLLLVFVEYVESNCYLLVNAIHVVDLAQNALPWSNIMKLLKDYDNADTELLIYATTLINKTLSGLSDQDSFYDESDFLEQQGMESVIQKYMSRPGTDLDLLDQLQLYDAVLRFEDGETDGIRISDNSVRKTPRCRSLNANGNELERRKSRRHSTGTSPNATMANTKCYSPRSTMAVHQTLDEDSSSSANSGELNDVFGVSKGPHENAGVTPGLRRRRERAERQKSFLREQQEAAATAVRPFDIKDEIHNNHGVLVTALPCRLQNDSPPNSINEINQTIESIELKAKDPQQRLIEIKNPLKSSKLPLVIENSIDKSNYVNINVLSAKCKAMSEEYSRNATLNNMDKPNQSTTDADTTTNQNKINNFYLQTNSSTANPTNGHIPPNKSMLSMINQKNLSNQKNLNGTLHATTNNNSNNNNNNNINSMCNVLNKNNNNNLNNNNINATNTNCNGSVKADTNDTKIGTPTASITVNGVDFNKNGLPIVSPPITTHQMPNDVNNGHQTQGTNKSSQSNGNQQQPYVIHNNGNALLANGKELKELPKTDIGKDSENDEKRLLLQIKRDHTVKDLTQKLSSLPINLQEEIKSQNRIGDMSGLISKAKEGLAKSKSKGDISRSPSKDQEIKKPEPKKSENELHWEELVKNMTRPLTLCDLDFTDLRSDDDKDDLMPRTAGAIPPPPPMGIIPPPMMKPIQPNLDPMNQRQLNGSKTALAPSNNTIKKNKKTVKLFWKEVREDLIPATIAKTIWDELQPTTIDTQKLEHLFESRAKDMMAKKQQELNKNKEIIVLDHKRSNAINIAMTKLPPPRAIKAAILKMDATVVTREGIDKLLNMLPTEEERGKIQEAQLVNTELPLGSAEQFLLTLSSISELSARLKLWAFKLDFECSEKEIAEPLMDLKQGLDALRNNKTFKCILSTLLSIGIFLNGAPVKGFQIEYLAKVPEVKDTVHKHSLLHHLCHIVMETSPDTTDLYSEIGPVTRASKADFADLAHNINYLESECKASWDRLKLIAKHDCPPQLKQKMVDFLADCAERIIILQIVHRRVINRYRKFLLWLGVPQHRIMESRPNEVCRIVSEFALEYRTTRERVHQQLEKKANHRERNKTRGKMIIDVAKFRSNEDRADAELKQLLGSQSPSVDRIDNPCQYVFRRRRADMMPRSPALKMTEDSFTDGDDELLESLVKTATSTPRTTPRERKRTRNADRKSFKRSRTREGFSVERTAASPEP